MDFKGREYKEGVDSNGAHFTTARHFFHMKELIEASNVFKIIRLLPKGNDYHVGFPLLGTPFILNDVVIQGHPYTLMMIPLPRRST